MAFFQWMWRGVLILVGIVVLIGFYLLMLQGVNLVTRLIQFPRGFVLSPQVEMLDPVLGLVHIVHQIDPVLTREGIDLTYTADDYPLTLRLCLQGLEGFYRHELDCISQELQSVQQVFDPELFSNFDRTYFLPNTSRSFQFESVLEVIPARAQALRTVSDPITLLWTPTVEVRTLQGELLSPGADTSGSPDIVLVQSRWKSLALQLNGQSSSDHITLAADPPPQLNLIPEDAGPPSSYHWLVSLLPQSVDQTSNELCLSLDEHPSQCYVFYPPGKGAAPIGESPTSVPELSPSFSEIPEGVPSSPSIQVAFSEPLLTLAPGLEVFFPHHRLSPDQLEIGGSSTAQVLRACLVSLKDGRIEDGRILAVSEQGLFQDHFAQRVLDLGPYSLFLFPDQTDSCFTLIPAWYQQEDRKPLPLSFEVVNQAEGLDAMDIKWLSTDHSILDVQAGLVIDQSLKVQDFATEVAVTSFVDLEVRVFAVLDAHISFTTLVPAHGQDSLRVKVPDLEYGPHRLVVYAVFPDGQVSADVIFPFEYIPTRLAAAEPSSQNLLKNAGIGFLLLSGSLYVFARFMMWRRESSKFGGRRIEKE